MLPVGRVVPVAVWPPDSTSMVQGEPGPTVVVARLSFCSTAENMVTPLTVMGLRSKAIVAP